MMRHVLLFAATVAFGTVARGQEPTPAASRAVGTGRFAALSNELALYSPLESPWVKIRANHAVESRLFSLLRAEVRLWDLQDTLTAQDSTAREDATEAARIIHGQILSGVAEALPLLQETPNKAFAQLLIHQLEAYPYEWKEEGSEQLLPDLRKTLNPDAAARRRRHRPPAPAATPTPREIPVAPAVPRASLSPGQ